MSFKKFIKANNLQIFVVAAFVFMTLISWFFICVVVNNKSRDYSRSLLLTAELNIQNRLAEAQNAGDLSIDADTVAADYLRQWSISGEGTGILLNADSEILAHPDASLIGENISLLYPQFAKYFQEAWEPVSGKRVTDSGGVSGILFTRPLPNGRRLAKITPEAVYYRDIYAITLVMLALTLILSAVICRVLTKVGRQKDRSELESLSKTSFLARISHEIRTPMNAIAGMSELILRKDVSPEIYDYAVNIKNASDSLLSIINDILDYSKLESGNIAIVSAKYQFSSLINDVSSIIRMRMLDKPVRFVINADSAIPAELIGDEARIRQILLNILTNSIKYTSDGHISLAVMTRLDLETKTAKLIFEIADTGIGIKDENIDKIFGDFVQTNNAGIIQGTGLGLTITKNLTEAMGGEIEVFSKYGEGSIFTVTIPQKFDEYSVYAAVTEAEAKNALVCESRAVYANSVICSIDNLGVKVTLASDESMFYNELSQNKYKYVFVSSFIKDRATDIIKRLMLDTTLIILAEYKDAMHAQNAKVLAMPAVSLTIADIFNDTTESDAYNFGKETYIGFTAPTARILVVDDIKTNLQVAEGLMAPYKMTIDTALSGAEAIELCKKNTYEIVFMDHMMPEMDGIEATHRIRALEDGRGYYKKLPIVTLTANVMAGMKEKFIQSGMDDFLAKPIELTKLNAILETWIPKNMMERYEKDASEQNPSEVKMGITGLDTKKGLAMTGGSWRNYEKTLTIYYYDAKQRLNDITKRLEEGDISGYTTLIHALKSASGSIGATALSSAAAALEDAANNKDMNFIGDNNGSFIRMLESLISELDKALFDKAEETEVVENDIPFLRDTLTKLKTALDEINMSAIDELIIKLESKEWAQDLKENIENIFKFVLLFEYESAVNLIDEIMAKYLK